MASSSSPPQAVTSVTMPRGRAVGGYACPPFGARAVADGDVRVVRSATPSAPNGVRCSSRRPGHTTRSRRLRTRRSSHRADRALPGATSTTRPPRSHQSPCTSPLGSCAGSRLTSTSSTTQQMKTFAEEAADLHLDAYRASRRGFLAGAGAVAGTALVAVPAFMPRGLSSLVAAQGLDDMAIAGYAQSVELAAVAAYRQAAPLLSGGTPPGRRAVHVAPPGARRRVRRGGRRQARPASPTPGARRRRSTPTLGRPAPTRPARSSSPSCSRTRRPTPTPPR